jgi:nucleoid-associated protein YgaU
LQSDDELHNVVIMKKGVFKMTADAKVGLLLGLFFIVVIAFLVNGLPNFIHKENPSPPGAAIITPTGPDMPLDNRVSDAVHRLYRPRQQRRTESPVQEVVLEPTPAIPPHVEIPAVVLPPQAPTLIKNDVPAVNPVVKTPVPVRTHVVKSGETLAVIAKMQYGEVEGNKLAVIEKLYEANKGVLKSPDRVCVGDKLVIPDIAGNTSSQVVKAPDPSKTLLGKFSNLLERVGEDDSRSISEYVVQEGDNLWAIAKTQLGDGNRYSDILRLNKGTLKSADEVAAGIRLKLPSQ